MGDQIPAPPEPREPGAREAVAKQFREFQQSRAKIGINYDDVVDFAEAYAAELRAERDALQKKWDIADLFGGDTSRLVNEVNAERARAEAVERSLLQARLIIERLSSAQGFEAIGSIPNTMWGNELKARMQYASNALVDLSK